MFMTIICNHFAIYHDFQSSPWKCNRPHLIQFWLHCRKWPLTRADTVQMTDTHSPFLTWGIIIIITGPGISDNISLLSAIIHIMILTSASAWHHNTAPCDRSGLDRQRANNCLGNPCDMRDTSRDICIIPGQTGASRLQICRVIISLFVCADHPR